MYEYLNKCKKEIITFVKYCDKEAERINEENSAYGAKDIMGVLARIHALNMSDEINQMIWGLFEKYCFDCDYVRCRQYYEGKCIGTNSSCYKCERIIG